MPPAAAAVVGFFASTTWYVVLVRTILVNVALGMLAKKLRRRPDQVPINITIRGPIEYRRLVLGTKRCSGVFAFYDTSSSGGSKRDILWYVIVVAGHQVSAITDMWIGNERIANADINAGSGAVTGGKFAGKLSIFKFLGTGAQTVETNLDAAFTAWTTNHRLRGCSGFVARMTRDDEVYDAGAPQSIGALVDGALMYDMRLDSTNGGSGSHRRDDPSTWSFTNVGRNPALHARWFISGGSVVNDQATRMIRYGIKDEDARILDSYFAAAANICDQSVSGANAPPSGAQSRYRCDLEVSCGETRKVILDKILATMAGVATPEHGQWRIFAGAYDAPTHAFTHLDLFGPIEVQDTDSHDERYNAVSATFIDASKGYIDQSTPFRTDSAYETQDGGEQIQREIALDGVTDQYQAQRLAEIELRKSRMMRTPKVVGALNLLKVAKYETFTLTHPRWNWDQRVFRCVERQFEFNEEAGRVSITARREDVGVYADMLTADYITGTSATDVFVTEIPDPPTSLSAAGVSGAVLLTVGLPLHMPPTDTVEIFEHTANTPFASATKIQEGRFNIFVVAHADATERFYWARISNRNGQTSSTEPSGNGLAGTPQRLQPEILTASDDSFTTPLADLETTILSITVPSQPYAYTAVVTGTGEVWATGNPAGAAIFLQYVDGGSTPTIPGTFTNTTVTASPGRRITLRGQLDVAASTSREFRFRSIKLVDEAQHEVRNAGMQVSVFRRP